LLSLIFVILTTAPASSLGDEGKGYPFPNFRRSNPAAKMPALPEGTSLKLLADEDFPPYSFKSGTGVAAGLAVELAMSACAEIKITCEVVLQPLGDLLPALSERKGDAVISGPRIDEKALQGELATRPWFRTFGRFAVPLKSPLEDADAKSLEGKKIGAVKQTAHEAWLKTYYSGSTLQPFDSEAKAYEALQKGELDAVFGDDLRLIYWVKGEASKGCCKLLGGAYTDFGGFTRNLSFIVRGDQPQIRDAFDVALDRLQDKGTTAKIFNAYVPLNPW
jgi:polar amino acid transport system substrate-binding protein